MKRSPLRRVTPLRPRKPPHASTKEAGLPATKKKVKRQGKPSSGFSAEVRQEALERDRCCQAAGVWPLVRCGGRLHVHHVLLRSQGGPDVLDNALVLCAVHHQIAHDVDRAGAEAAGIIKRWSATT